MLVLFKSFSCRTIEIADGELAIEKGFTSLDQVIEALAIQARENIEKRIWRPIGEILAQLGHITDEQIKEIVEAKFERRFGEVAISRGLITLEQLIDAMTVQVKEEAMQGRHRLMGEILVDKCLLSSPQVLEVLNEMGSNFSE